MLFSAFGFFGENAFSGLILAFGEENFLRFFLGVFSTLEGPDQNRKLAVCYFICRVFRDFGDFPVFPEVF